MVSLFAVGSTPCGNSQKLILFGPLKLQTNIWMAKPSFCNTMVISQLSWNQTIQNKTTVCSLLNTCEFIFAYRQNNDVFSKTLKRAKTYYYQDDFCKYLLVL